MAKKLDLTAFKREYWEVTLFNGETINIGKPSQGLIIDMMAMEQKVKEISEDNNAEMMSVFNDIIFKVISNNKEQKKFTTKFVKDNFDFEIGQVFLYGFMEFVQEVQSSPNS